MTKITLKKSSDLGKRPLADQLEGGEVALNIHPSEPGAYFRTTQNRLVKIGPAHVSPTAPNFIGSGVGGGQSGYSIGELWLENSTGTLFIRDTDGNSEFWVQV